MTLDAQEILEEPTIPQGVSRSLDTITPKLQDLKFEDYNTRKQKELARNQFMVTEPSEPPNADIVSAMEWACKLEQSRILNLLRRPDFGRIAPV